MLVDMIHFVVGHVVSVQKISSTCICTFQVEFYSSLWFYDILLSFILYNYYCSLNRATRPPNGEPWRFHRATDKSEVRRQSILCRRSASVE